MENFPLKTYLVQTYFLLKILLGGSWIILIRIGGYRNYTGFTPSDLYGVTYWLELVRKFN